MKGCMNANEIKLADGSTGIRMAGRASIGQVVMLHTAKSVSRHSVTAVKWTGVANDGTEASLVTTRPLSRAEKLTAVCEECGQLATHCGCN